MASNQQLSINDEDGKWLLDRKPLTPMELLQVALSNNAAIDVIERLAALQKDFQQQEAETQFTEALSRIQAKISRIAPDLTNPEKGNKYASYAAIDRIIRPLYTAEGMSLSFSAKDCPLPEHIRVICYVSRGAYTREYMKDMPIDTKGPKGNPVMTPTHAHGAADSYAKRYLVKDIFNLAIGEEDRDGNAPQLSDLAERLEWIENCADYGELQKIFGQAYKDARALNDQQAMKAIVAAKDKKKKEFM